MKLKHKLALFVIYFVLFIALTAMIDYYAYDVIRPTVFIIISFVAAFVATWIHGRGYQKSKVDELAHEIEEIL